MATGTMLNRPICEPKRPAGKLQIEGAGETTRAKNPREKKKKNTVRKKTSHGASSDLPVRLVAKDDPGIQ